VDRPQVSGCNHPNTGLHQLSSVSLTLVAEWITLASDNKRGRQVLQLLNRCFQRRRGRLFAHGNIWRVVVPEPFHRLACQEITRGELMIGRRVEVGVRRRRKQNLEIDRGATALFEEKTRFGL
jgi:hypothetical protein